MSEPELITEGNLSVQAARYAPYFLSVINNRLSWGASQVYLQLFDIGLNEWRILSALRNEPGIQALRVGEMVAMNKSVVSRSTRRLEEMGHVVAKLDRTKRLLWLSRSGAELHDKIFSIALQRETALLDGFDAAELDTLFAMLERMRANLAKVDAVDRGMTGRELLPE
ncbi:MarR family winged helix-turn-helix transcriptional regulator [Pararhodobacter sp. CCB-MM2]|uniref:MarR family winged helix-turn-helix transcriptional regulator n=1 Tax=Pararhodobacter sp. CCB-MM2 TaxID=1786003 RepID=UPI00082D07C9|nr:MarR family winged helix-turn-helix transcriptional regulator [Pararhodobacter sp. CCB-MM2]MCA2011581.1 MarR family winged helix-turn-helix transcriptional regulator [Cereibacter sphaeroides]